MDPLLPAAALAAALGVAHSVLGERYIVRRLLRRQDLPRLFGDDRFARATLRYAWHVTTLAWLGLAGVLVAVALEAPPARVALVVAATFAVTSLYGVVATRARHLSWVVTAAIALLAWAGSR